MGKIRENKYCFMLFTHFSVTSICKNQPEKGAWKYGCQPFTLNGYSVLDWANVINRKNVLTLVGLFLQSSCPYKVVICLEIVSNSLNGE